VKEARPEDELDMALFGRLKELRKRLAAEHNVPAYIIFSDAVLIALTAQRPQSDAELGKISGIGPKKLAQYGEAFLAVLKDS
jgi:ATP-dependent DNA helicase RecQ